jgi:hypothetical protein
VTRGGDVSCREPCLANTRNVACVGNLLIWPMDEDFKFYERRIQNSGSMHNAVSLSDLQEGFLVIKINWSLPKDH